MGSTRQSLLRLSPPFRAEEGGEWLGFLESCGRHSLPCRLASKTLQGAHAQVRSRSTRRRLATPQTTTC
jgi:hypothetical protein